MKTEAVHTRLDKPVKDAFSVLAKQLNYPSVAALKRTLITEAVTGYPDLDAARYGDIRRLRTEVNKVGVNLNQIAYRINRDRRPDDRDVIAAVEDAKVVIRDAMRAYSSLLKLTKARKLGGRS